MTVNSEINGWLDQLSKTTKEPPSHWKIGPVIMMPGHGPAAKTWDHKVTNIRVLRSISLLENKEWWIHVSVSRPDRLPTWEEMNKVRNEFIGEDVEAYHVCPRKQDYVNVAVYCLHLWAPVDGKRRVANLQDLILEGAI